jgi:hypothetical protein
MAIQPADYTVSFNSFVGELEERILPFYLEHELTFDPWGVHGRMHICRSVLFAEWMARFYLERSLCDIDLYAVRVATAMHDSGRRANGVDRWEADSATRCYDYVKLYSPRAGDAEYARFVAGLIDKRKTGDTCKRIVYDADVLEIMRPCCGHGGIGGFRRECLHFAGGEDTLAVGLDDSPRIREAFIQEAWKWISDTEAIKLRLYPSATYMADLLGKLQSGKARYPMLSSLCEAVPLDRRRQEHEPALPGEGPSVALPGGAGDRA